MLGIPIPLKARKNGLQGLLSRASEGDLVSVGLDQPARAAGAYEQARDRYRSESFGRGSREGYGHGRQYTFRSVNGPWLQRTQSRNPSNEGREKLFSPENPADSTKDAPRRLGTGRICRTKFPILFLHGRDPICLG